MKILNLTLQKKWYDAIFFSDKREEYRTIKPYWVSRLEGRKYDAVFFRNGYRTDSRSFYMEFKGVTKGLGNRRWGAPNAEQVYIIQLGELIDKNKIVHDGQ